MGGHPEEDVRAAKIDCLSGESRPSVGTAIGRERWRLAFRERAAICAA